jgi:hypothetical protein
MPAGDAQRVWFPEMLTRLQGQWQEAMALPAFIELRDALDAMLHQIRSARNISSPMFTCPKCGVRGPMAEPRVSVRAMILALGRFGITTKGKTQTLERAWSQYRSQHGLDIYGKSLIERHHGESCCGVDPLTPNTER